MVRSYNGQIDPMLFADAVRSYDLFADAVRSCDPYSGSAGNSPHSHAGCRIGRSRSASWVRDSDSGGKTP